MSTLRTTATVLSVLALSMTGTSIAHAQPNTVPEDSIAASVVSVDGNMECSGAMISPSWALTSRHCVTDQDQIPVTTGINQDGETYTANVVEHGNTDLALLNIDGVHAGTVASLPTSFAEVGTTAMIAGFGSADGVTESATEKTAHVNARMDMVGPGDIVTEGWEQFLYHVPADNDHLYMNDTGAPVFIGDEIHGVFSHGWLNDNNEFTESYSASVADNIDWIRMITGIDGDTWWSMAMTTPGGPGDMYADIDNDYEAGQWNHEYVTPDVNDTGPWSVTQFPGKKGWFWEDTSLVEV